MSRRFRGAAHFGTHKTQHALTFCPHPQDMLFQVRPSAVLSSHLNTPAHCHMRLDAHPDSVLLPLFVFFVRQALQVQKLEPEG